MFRKPTSHATRHRAKQNLNEQNNKPKYLMPKGAIRYNGKIKQQNAKHTIPCRPA
ncbi:hypothetical protein L873DRAFT_1812447 [Choiromyces venosus 120613-1]|uniref:Uncharacterized protein n=1 Tax=Choiromyces venosus 120613-1 TaxID=1336337 RepID=A0A3N4JFD6_9PEZI|nr:hypothetical protein L873DRAFT_1812447 [Choiromyces venosus 120613-1]